MKLEWDFDDLHREMQSKAPKIVKDVVEYTQEAFTKEIMSEAAPIIEDLLKLTSSLPTKNGMYQFYDTQSDIAKAKRGWLIPKNTGDPHLLHMWKTDYRVGKNGDCTIIVSNDKLVKGKNGDFFLFNLLWNGTKPYIVTAELSDKRQKKVIPGTPYKSGKRKGEMRRDKTITIPSEQDKFKKKYGTPAFKQWEQQMKELRAHQNKMLGTRNWHISAVEQDRRRRSNYIKGEKEAADRERAQRIRMQAEQAGVYENHNANYGDDQSGGTELRRQSITPTFSFAKFDDYKNMYKVLIHEKGGIISGFKPKKMHYFNRFNNKFYYNQIYRKGIDNEVVSDFREYVATCVYRGIMMATGNTDIGNKAMMVQTFGSTRGGNDIIYSH
jgi:hypothetical protein